MTKKNKILILTGAGFTSSKDFFDITTDKLTKLIRESNINNIKISGKTPGEYFYSCLKDYYSNFEEYKDNNDLELKVSGYINFETILHFIEELYSVIVPFNALIDNKKNNSKYTAKNIGMKPAALYIKPEILMELTEATTTYKSQIASISGKNHSKDVNVRYFIRAIYLKFIELIANNLGAKLNDQKNNKGYNDFLNFLEKYFPPEINYWRWYTLNYDDWIQRYFDKFVINDGFVFNNEFLLFPHEITLERHCHYNLHGCINWFVNTNKNLISKKQKGEVINYNDINFYSSYSMSRDPLILTPIISGYNKATRISYDPFMSFFSSFSFDISNADLMIVIGYGLGDHHINNLIKKRNPPILFIDYKQDSIDKINFIQKVTGKNKTEIKKLLTKNSFIHDDDCHYFYFNGIGASFYEISDQIINQISTVHKKKFI